MQKELEIRNLLFDSNEIKKTYDEFKIIYKNRPIKKNDGGMKIPQAFGLWYFLKKLKPKLVLESGVWKGQSTWLIENACTDCEIFSIDINLSRLEYKSQRAKYFDIDFQYIDFTAFNLEDAICFFDDHQNALTRLQQMHWKGFKKAIFDDNYPVKQGDCYSIKKILSGCGFSSDNNTCSETVTPNFTHKRELLNNVKSYYEFPPLFKEKNTRWGDLWDDINYPTQKAILDCEYEDEFRGESKDYNWICYVELK